jgi:phosphatidylinositol-3-phosphatase
MCSFGPPSDPKARRTACLARKNRCDRDLASGAGSPAEIPSQFQGLVRCAIGGVDRLVIRMTAAFAACVLLILLGACGLRVPAAVGATPSAHVFVIVMENQSPAEALSTSYVASLAQQYAVLTNYHAVAHPSLPNYLAITSGSTWGIRDDGFHPLPAGGLGAQLTSAGVSWRAYMEDMTRTCRSDTGAYAVKHDPFAYYGDSCPPNIVTFDQLSSDLASGPPAFSWIGPDLCHDTHDCPLSTGDAWLSFIVPQILASPAWKQNGILFITWDEDDNSSNANAVSTLVIAPHLKAHSSATYYDHYSLLATIEDLLHVGRLGRASGAAAISLVDG